MKRTLLLLLLLYNSFLFAQVNLNQGLVAYYPFNGNANDASGNNNNPIFNNATLTADRLGNSNGAYSFNGVDNYIQIPNSPSLNPTNQISICAWVKVSGFYQGPCHGNNVVMKGDADYLTGNYVIRFDDSYSSGNQNCFISSPDIAHESFFGIQSSQLPNNPFIQTNQWYSVVFTCDGVTANTYVNCQLVGSGPANGVTFSNGYDLFLGRLNDPQYPYWFNGVMDEVRIYNRALNDDEIKAYGDCTTSVGIIINDYTPVVAFNPCDNKITVEDASAFNPGDTVLMIQMKGAVIDSSNTSNFGTITNYKNAGNYEFNYVKSKTGNIIELKNALTKQYDVPYGKVQLVRVPYYKNVTLSSNLTCLPWDGNKGGIVVLNVEDAITLNANIDVSGKGFRGAVGYNPQNATLDCFQNNYNYPISSNADAAQKGESVTTISDNIICGKGNPAGGGGGGLGHNSGGGGGGNGGGGGFGGYQLDACGNSPFDNRGIGGHSLNYSSSTNKIFLGSGGGAGQADNVGNLPNNGGSGGGIIIINSSRLISNNYKIVSNGNDGTPCSMPPSTDCHDGMGGGGAGGSILLSINQLLDNTVAENKGGKGADMIGSVALGHRIGAGGGGGGGLLFLKSNTIPGNLININSGGINGVLTTDGNNSYGATPGQNGVAIFNLQIPIDSILFKPNIDSIKIKDSTVGCNSFNFQNLWFTNANPVNSWQWDFGDGNTGNTQNINHTYNTTTSTTYTIKIVVADINGCKDSSFAMVTTSNPPIVKTNNDTAFCSGNQVQLNTTGVSSYSWLPSAGLSNYNIANPIATPAVTTQYVVIGTRNDGCASRDTVNITVHQNPAITKSNDTVICKNSSAPLFAGGGTIYNWSPSTSLNNTSIFNPIATPVTNTIYYVSVTDGNNCKNSDSIKVNIRPDPVFIINSSANICLNNSVQLNATGGNIYSWQPSASLNNPSISNPTAAPKITTNYFVLITDTVCNNSTTLSTMVTVFSLPIIKADKSNDLDCSHDFSQLSVAGGIKYVWSPSATLNSSSIANPVAHPTSPTLYLVKGSDVNGCENYDSVMVNITDFNKSGYFMPNAFTPNNDGLNDCYGIKYWGIIQELDFGIYNRWGQKIFHTSNPNDCWDGTFKGVKQDPDVYVYLITAKTFCGKVFKKGTFALIR